MIVFLYFQNSKILSCLCCQLSNAVRIFDIHRSVTVFKSNNTWWKIPSALPTEKTQLSVTKSIFSWVTRVQRCPVPGRRSQISMPTKNYMSHVLLSANGHLLINNENYYYLFTSFNDLVLILEAKLLWVT